MTLSEFFSDKESSTRSVLTEEQYRLFEGWAKLSPEQKRILVELIQVMDS